MNAFSRLRVSPSQLVAPFRRGATRTVPAAVLPGSELVHLGGGETIPCPGVESLPLSASARAHGLGLSSLALPACKVHVLRDVSVLPGSRVVRDAQGRVVAESLTSELASRLHLGERPGPPLEVDGPVALYRSPLRGDLHTIVDHLPRAALLTQPAMHRLGRVTLLHDGPLDPLEELLLPRLLGSRVDLLEVDPGREVRAERVLLPGFVTRPGAGAIPSWYRRWLDRTATAIDDPALAVPRRVFVYGVRSDPVVRDREHLEEVLARHDVERVHLPSLDAADQVRALRNAELVIGLPGDGLARAAFSRSAHVVELVPGTEVPGDLYYLCAATGLPYDYVLTSGGDRSASDRRGREVHIDVEALDRLLSRPELTARSTA